MISFSIVTICYNAENEIEDTINSIISQDYKNFEYIFIDGGSTDNTNDIIRTYYPKFNAKSIRYLHISEKDRGISDAFNKGIGMARHDVIGLINAGDCLMPGALSALDMIFKNNYDVVYGNTLCIDKKHGLKYLRRIPKDLDHSKIPYNGLIFTHQSAFVKRILYEKFGLYDISYKYVMDTDFFCRLYKNGIRFHYLDRCLVSMLAGGVSSRFSSAMFRENLNISQKYGGYSKKRMIFNLIKGLPLRFAKNLLKRFPKAWYWSIGEERNWSETDENRY